MESCLKDFNMDNVPTEKYDDTFRLIPGYNADLVNAAKVMVVGAGALGNEVLKNLALMNVGYILIVDYDTIEYHNLCRSVLFRESDISETKVEVAAKMVKQINPKVKVMTINGKIPYHVGLGVLRRMDVAIGCLDSRYARYSLNRMCYKVRKTWVDGAIERLMGTAQVYKPYTSCYECNLSDSEIENIKKQMNCPGVAKEDILAGRIPTTPIASSIIGAIQVQEALKVIQGYNDKLILGQFFNYEGLSKEVGFYKTQGLSRTNCTSHYSYNDIIEAKELTSKSTLKELFEYLSTALQEQNPIIRLDYTLVNIIVDDNTEKKLTTNISLPWMTKKFLKENNMPTDKVYYEGLAYISNKFENLNLTLNEIGFPPLHIIKIEGERQDYFVELSGDIDYFNFK